MKNILCSLLLLGFLYSCLQDDVYNAYSTTNIIFQSEYTNNAWGYNHNGWMMTNTGQTKRFQKSANWVFPDSLGYVSEADMEKNLAACDSTIEIVSPAEYSTYATKALTCVNGNLSRPQNVMADAGENIWAFYVYDAEKKRYKRVILTTTGDWSQENQAAGVKEIVDWMKTIK